MLFNFGKDFYLPAVIILTIWLSLISFFLYRIIVHYNRLTRGITKGDLRSILEKILAKVDLSAEKIEELTEYCQKIEKEGRFHIKKVGVLRFNPFKDTGGNQSFVLALLNEENDGLVLSSLYTRTGSRWYVKKVQEGKGVEVNLSKEEEEAIKKAKT